MADIDKAGDDFIVADTQFGFNGGVFGHVTSTPDGTQAHGVYDVEHVLHARAGAEYLLVTRDFVVFLNAGDGNRNNMDAIKNILERVSVAQLTGPEITAEQKEILFQAALRAPDHAWLRPSRYLTIEGDARQYLSEVYYQSLPDKDQLSDEKVKKMRNRLMRAPLIVVAITRIQEHYKVPRDEQILSRSQA